MSYRTILVDREDHVAIVRLNRPDVLNALNSELMFELVRILEDLENDQTVRAIVLTGGGEVFTTGADLKEIAERTPVNLILESFVLWDKIRKISKPIVAAVSGYCLGAGNELAMNCDVIIASETATFGQPEVKVGIIPGAGGTQWLTREVGKHKAMEMILTGEPISAEEAHRIGLVNRVVAVENLIKEARKVADQIATKPAAAIRSAKAAILKAQDAVIEEGLEFERKAFYALFSTEESKERILAFLEKRKPLDKGK